MTASTDLLRLCHDDAIRWAERAGFYGREVSDRQRELRNRIVVLQRGIYYDEYQGDPGRVTGLRVERDLCIGEFRRLDARSSPASDEFPRVYTRTGGRHTPTRSATSVRSSSGQAYRQVYHPAEVQGVLTRRDPSLILRPEEEAEPKPVVVEWSHEYVFDKDEYVVSVIMQHGDEFDVTWAHIPKIDVEDNCWEEHDLPEEVIRGLKERDPLFGGRPAPPSISSELTSEHMEVSNNDVLYVDRFEDYSVVTWRDRRQLVVPRGQRRFRGPDGREYEIGSPVGATRMSCEEVPRLRLARFA